MYPVIFIGHGSPMNAVEDNDFTKGWKEIKCSIPKPKAILVISAHWESNNSLIQANEKPATIYDFYGFPKALYEIIYESKGSIELANKTLKLVKDSLLDEQRGYDHGVWSVLQVMYPEADIPVIQMSIDLKKSPKELFKIGEALKPLREEGVLILGSGNIVHNLRLASYNIAGGYDWAHKFDDFIYEKIKGRDFDAIIKYEKFGEAAKLAVPEPSHFNPLLYVLGAVDEKDEVSVYNRMNFAGSVSMTSYVFKEVKSL